MDRERERFAPIIDKSSYHREIKTESYSGGCIKYCYYKSSNSLKAFFELEERGSSYNKEFRASIATFLTMCYILLVNPQLLSKIGISVETVVMSTAIASSLGSFIAGFFGNLPIGLAPGIGLSAYLVYGLVLGEQYTIKEAFTACFLSGIVLLFLSISGLSKLIMMLIPRSVKLATIVGMGMQIALVGMTSVKMVVSNKDTLVGLGDIHSYEVWLTIVSLVMIGSLLYHQVTGSIVIGIVALTVIHSVVNHIIPTKLFEIPDFATAFDQSLFVDLNNIDIMKIWPALLSFVFVGIIDVSGVIYGMASLANIIKPDGSVPGTTSAFIAVSISTLLSAFTGGSPIIVYVESAAGIKEGGRTGLTAIFISFFFLLSMFFTPLLSQIPAIATAPVSMLIGAMMMSQATEIDWNNMSEAIPAFLTMIFMPFTFSITNGIIVGLMTSFMFYFTTGQIFIDFDKLLCGNDYIDNSSNNNNLEAGAKDTELIPLNNTTSTTTLLNKQSSDITSNSNYKTYNINGSNIDLNNNNNNISTNVTRDNLMFLDDQPFVRIPSLLLTRRDSEALKKSTNNNNTYTN